MIILENEAAKLQVESNIFAGHALNAYKQLNKERFEDFETIDLFEPVLRLIFACHEQCPNVRYNHHVKPAFSEEARYGAAGKKVLVCCSGGLDSVYQALKLQEAGCDVTLMHLSGANFYSNGQEYKAFREFADKFGFKTYEPKISPKHNGEYRKFWAENSFKDFLIYCIAIDYMLNHGMKYLSSGDDLRLSMKDQVTGVNTGDARELTVAFMESFGVNFIPVDATVDKAQRLAYLEENGARDYYLSCVGPGRLIQSQRKRYEAKFSVKLDRWCCCSCRKCCMHLLLDHYYNNKKLPQELVDRCWDKLGDPRSADHTFFCKDIPLEQRIKNLVTY